MRELWQEIMASITRNKLRTVLTGFSVAWGIFMLMVLLGAGKGLENGAMSTMSARTLNVISVGSWRTSLPYKGYQKDRQIKLNKTDTRFIENQFDNVEKVSGTFSKRANASADNNFVPVNMEGVTPEYAGIRQVEMLKGRFPNEMDMQAGRKVAAVENDIADILYPRSNPIGKNFVADGVTYTIVGVTKPRRWGGTLNAYVPLSTMESVYAATFKNYGSLTFLVNDLETEQENLEFNDRVKNKLKYKHSIAPEDPEGIYINNRYQQYTENKKVLGSITLFIWGVGILTLLAGIVGVSNIMLVTVQERMNEIGIRKAIGATPRAILTMILSESLIITIFFGYIGLIAGMGVTEAANSMLKRSMEEGGNMSMIFSNPTIDMSIAVWATVVLIAAGLVAGFIPALRAVRMKTIDTLRQQK